jgi:hypothetical protein
MPSAKDLRVAPIAAVDANAFVRHHHYSGKVVRNSQLHLGVFLGDRLEGAMQFGPPLDRRKLLGLVAGTRWNDCIELSRLVFSERLPRNSESRALAVAFRLMRREYPHLQWVVSFADGTQCGDGTIYRAAGFVLTGITANKTIWLAPSGECVADLTLRQQQMRGGSKAGATDGSSSMRSFKAAGYRPLTGFQLRYLYFLDPSARERLSVPLIPFSKIAEIGAGMYRGKARGKQAMAEHPSDQRRRSTDHRAPPSVAA